MTRDELAKVQTSKNEVVNFLFDNRSCINLHKHIIPFIIPPRVDFIPHIVCLTVSICFSFISIP